MFATRSSKSGSLKIAHRKLNSSFSSLNSVFVSFELYSRSSWISFRADSYAEASIGLKQIPAAPDDFRPKLLSRVMLAVEIAKSLSVFAFGSLLLPRTASIKSRKPI